MCNVCVAIKDVLLVSKPELWKMHVTCKFLVAAALLGGAPYHPRNSLPTEAFLVRPLNLISCADCLSGPEK